MTHAKLIRLSPASSLINRNITVPGSKSYSNRALLMAAIASGTSYIRGASLSDDSNAMIEALKRLGVEIENEYDALVVKGRGKNLTPYKGEINVGPAGTTFRFLTSLLASIPGTDVVLSGSPRMHERPIHELVDALRLLGAKIDYVKNDGFPPLRIRGQAFKWRRSFNTRENEQSIYLFSPTQRSVNE